MTHWLLTKKFPQRTFLIICAVTPLLAQSPQPDATGVEFFEQKIRPVFATRCYVCHSAAAPKIQGGLELDSRDGLRKGGNSGSPLVPGDPDSSLLIQALRYNNANLKMPPGKALPPEVVADFERWVRMGAPDPRTVAPSTLASTKSREWWSLKRPVRPTVPDIGDKGWPKTPIDNFILAKLDAAALKPSAPTDRRTLIRRATYDLIGLPPTQKEIDDFASDTSPNAFEKVVERLLRSPQYGVRWGRHWLDVARYADTSDGTDRFAFSYTYRDWVIQAFNDDMPFDQFAKKQIAADQLSPPDPRDLAALGFITLGRSVPKGEHDMIDDRIDAISRGFLGMTVTCARCHDHKFDPIPTRDYYSLYGIIANSIEPVEYPLLRTESANSPLVKQYRQGIERRLAILNEFKTKRHAQLVAEFRQASWISRYLLGAQQASNMDNASIETLSRDRDFNLYMLRRWREYLRITRERQDPVFEIWNAFASTPKDQFAAQAQYLPASANEELKKVFAANPPASMDDVTKIYGELLAKFDSPEVNSNPDAEALRLVLRGDNTPTNVPLSDFVEIRGDGGDDNILKGLEGAIREWQAEFGYRGITPRAMGLQESARLVPAHVFVRGNPNNPGAETPPHFLSALDPGQPPFTHGSGRLDLANAIAGRNNPVTARVIVNRVWQWHFGRGIVNSPSDFGTRGDLPTHPELLDYLATRFMDEGWSIKKLHKWIMLSSAYQQSSQDRSGARAVDPENKLVWRMNRQRLDFESLRDSILFVSGQLDLSIGGLPFSLPAQPAVPRRTAYAYLERGHLPGEMGAFDFAIPESHVPQRFLTTVPQQALYLMNSPFILEESKHLVAAGEIRASVNDRARITALYHAIYGRAATSDEVQLALDYIQNAAGKPQPVPKPANQSGPVWQYGLASMDEAGRIERFEPMKYFVEQKWLPASLTPQPVFGGAELSAKGGAPSDDPNKAVVRRWVSPISGTVKIDGKVTNEVVQKPEEYHQEWGDGIRARIIVNGIRKLVEEIVYNRKAELAVKELIVAPGDTIDFAVDCMQNSENDGFQWTPVITLKSPQQIWDAHTDFAGPAPMALNAWEKLAQVLLQTSEFAFVD